MGRVGSWKPSWAPTPIPSQPTEALPSSRRSGDKILLVFEFLLRNRGSLLRVLPLPHPGPPGPARRSIFYFSIERMVHTERHSQTHLFTQWVSPGL